MECVLYIPFLFYPCEICQVIFTFVDSGKGKSTSWEHNKDSKRLILYPAAIFTEHRTDNLSG